MASKLDHILCPLICTLLFPLSNAFAGTNLAPPSVGDSIAVLGGHDCADGVVKDDGTLETGSGWVPSVVDGRDVQRFEAAEFRSRKMEEICICWTRTRMDDELRFQVQLYRDRGGRPALFPEESVDAVATLVPSYPDGAFYSFDVSGADMHAPTEVFYLGVQWDPSQEDYFFVCVDKTADSPVVDGWFIDDRADEWTSVLDTFDPTFNDHRAMMIRARALEGFFPLVPTVGPKGVAFFVVMIACLGAALLARRKS